MSSLSFIYHKLRSNAVFTNEEETQVRRAMATTLNKLKTIESETAHLQDRLIVLKRRKRDTEKMIKAQQGLLSPIRRLVPEILQEIFWRCLPTAHNSVLSSKEAPLVLGRVCSQWRQIAYSTPKLWSLLHITTVPLASPGAKVRFEAYGEWLSRSGILPLSISMSEVRGVPASQLRSYFDLIANHARRWQHVNLYFPSYNSIDFLVEMDADDFPLLETFYIDKGVPRDESTASIGHALSRKNSILFAPSLRSLSIHEPSLQLLNLPIQWVRLTVLDLRNSVLPEVFQFFALCPNLEICRMSLGFATSSLSSPTHSQPSYSRPKIILSRLRSLEISGGLHCNSNTVILLNNLSTPALRHFAYQHHVWPYSRLPFTDLSLSLKVFRSFFQKLNEPLEELNFDSESVPAKYWVELLSLFPQLKRLSLRVSLGFRSEVVNDHLLSGLIPHEHPSKCQECSLEEEQPEDHGLNTPSFICLCPNLEVINVNHAFLSKRILLKCLYSRLVDYEKYDIARLRRFKISFGWIDEEHDITKEIEKLVKESGLSDMRLSQCPEIVRKGTTALNVRSVMHVRHV